MSDQLREAAKNMADWMKYLLDANPDLGRMCRSYIRHGDDGIVTTRPASVQADYDALVAALAGYPTPPTGDGEGGCHG